MRRLYCLVFEKDYRRLTRSFRSSWEHPPIAKNSYEAEILRCILYSLNITQIFSLIGKNLRQEMTIAHMRA